MSFLEDYYDEYYEEDDDNDNDSVVSEVVESNTDIVWINKTLEALKLKNFPEKESREAQKEALIRGEVTTVVDVLLRKVSIKVESPYLYYIEFIAPTKEFNTEFSIFEPEHPDHYITFPDGFSSFENSFKDKIWAEDDDEFNDEDSNFSNDLSALPLQSSLSSSSSLLSSSLPNKKFKSSSSPSSPSSSSSSSFPNKKFKSDNTSSSITPPKSQYRRIKQLKKRQTMSALKQLSHQPQLDSIDPSTFIRPL